MKSDQLGKIKRIEIREIFKDEARDFTPWLAKSENLELLSDELGVDIKLIEVEANVGRYNVDILAQEDGTENKIIIENQFGHTDHDHLGKLITYASGHDAKIIIWIFEDMRDEHRQAIEWLNENTNPDVDFFAVNIQLWKIDNSVPAPKFEIIVSPNQWTKTIRSKSSGELSETKLNQLDFWTRFREYGLENIKNLKFQKPSPQHWYNIAIGSSEAHVSLTVNTQKDEIACELYIGNNKDLYHYLKEQGHDIESRIGSKLEWIEASKASRIKTTKTKSPMNDSLKNNEIFKWFGEVAQVFQKVFYEMIKDYSNSR